MTQMITRGISNKILPMTPLISINGIKAAMVVSEEAITGANMRQAPCSAAVKGVTPC